MGYAETMEASLPVEVIDYGVMGTKNWLGAVSAKAMIEAGETSQTTINEAVARINEFYIPASPDAPARCIDGRYDPDLSPEKLGAQLPGGAPGAALAYRLGVDKDDLTRGTFLTDADAMVDTFIRHNFALGGHRDEGSKDLPKVGCGAIDAMDAILAAMIDRNLIEDHKRITQQLLGADFYRDDYLRVLGAATIISSRSDEYFENRGAIIDKLEERDPSSVPVLQGSHKECIVIANDVPHTTLDSNLFSKTFDGMQAFGYDIWQSKLIAHALLPRPDQQVDRRRFVMARVMSTVATLLVLTDGTQRLIGRVPGEVEAQ